MPEPPSTPPEFDLTLAEAATWVGTGPHGIGQGPPDPSEEEHREIEGDDPAVALRRTLGMFATGVTVITTKVGDQVHVLWELPDEYEMHGNGGRTVAAKKRAAKT